MKISEQQLWWLLEIAKASLIIAGEIGIDEKQRLALVNEIIAQQDSQLVEVGKMESNINMPILDPHGVMETR